MGQRKHTRCASCGAVVFGRYLEVMWRDDPKRPFWWVGGWMCAGCREGIVQLLEGISGVVLAVDG